MTQVEIKYMDDKFKAVVASITKLSDKVDPLIVEVAKMQGAISAIKWAITLAVGSGLIAWIADKMTSN